MKYEIESSEIDIISSRNTKILSTVVIPKGGDIVSYPLVAYVHGFAGDRDEGGGIKIAFEELARRGISSIRMDFPGHGKSQDSAKDATLSKMTDDVFSCLQYMIKNFPVDTDFIGLIGSSLGARVLLNLHKRKVEPPLKAVMLISPAGSTDPIIGVMGGKEEFLRRYEEACEVGYYEMTLYDITFRLSKEWFEDITNIDIYEKTTPYSCPVRVLYAQDDEVVPPSVSKHCAKFFDAELVEISGGGHALGFYDEDTKVRDITIAAIVEYFSELLLSEQ